MIRDYLGQDSIIVGQDLMHIADTSWLGAVGVHSLSVPVKEQRLEWNGKMLIGELRRAGQDVSAEFDSGRPKARKKD